MIQINDKWAINPDVNSVNLHKKAKKGWILVGYYNNYSHALQALVDRDVQELQSLKHIVSRINELKNDIVKVLGPASPLKEII